MRTLVAKKKTKKKSSKTKGKSKKKAFGGYTINFSGRKETLEQVFGKKPLPPSQMTKKIWVFIKAKGIASK